MPLEHIEHSDTLRIGTDKLNKAIDASNTAENEAKSAVIVGGEAKTIAESAEVKASSVQAQFEQVVIDGDSSVEAAAARVAPDKTYATLKDRLDEKEQTTAQELADRAPWIAVNLFERLAPEVNDTGRLQRVIDSTDRGVVWFDGSYKIGNINLKSNVSLMATRGTTITFVEGSSGFNVTNTINASFYDFEFNGFEQLTSSNYMIKGINAENILISGCKLKDGRHGIYLQDAKNGIIERCIAVNFAMWAFYIEGCDGFKLLNIISNNGAYDGLKMGGLMTTGNPNLIKNIEVANCFCIGNARDGFDLAGNNVEIVNIHNNQFVGNGLQGIDFKIVYQGDYMRNVRIHDNLCINNLEHQINISIGILSVIVEELSIYDNELKCPNNINSTGLRLSGIDKNGYVYDNQIHGGQYGIRLIDSSDVNIFHNKLKNQSKGIVLELQVLETITGNVLEENEVLGTSGECIIVLHAGVTNTEILRNKNKTLGTGNRITDLGTNTIMNDNLAGYSSTNPSGRGTKGEIIKNTNPANNSFEKWVAINSSGSATWVGIGKIGGKETRTATLTTTPIGIRNYINVDYQQMTCVVGDMVDVMPLSNLPNGIAWSASIIGANKIRIVIFNLTDAIVDVSGLNWRIDVTK